MTYGHFLCPSCGHRADHHPVRSSNNGARTHIDCLVCDCDGFTTRYIRVQFAALAETPAEGGGK